MRIAAGRVVGDGGTVELDKKLPRGGRVKVVYLGEGGRVLDESRTQQLFEARRARSPRRGVQRRGSLAALPPRK